LTIRTVTREERRANGLAATLYGSSLSGPTQAPPRKVALIVGVLFLITFVASIAGVLLYAAVLHPVKYIVGAGDDTRVRLGAVCELILIIPNVGTAVVLFPILKRQNESLALGYVATLPGGARDPCGRPTVGGRGLRDQRPSRAGNVENRQIRRRV
jgi:hypothetical protein